MQAGQLDQRFVGLGVHLRLRVIRFEGRRGGEPVEGASAEEIGKSARSQGMSTLRDDGMEKVRQGVTSIEEILRVVV